MERPSNRGPLKEWSLPLWRRALYGLATAALVCVALAAVCEIGARWHLGARFAAGLPPAGRPVHAIAMHDPHAGWANKPNVTTRVEGPNFQYVVRHNSRGQRGEERPLAKAPGTRRVLLLGDSLAWGWGVDDGREYAAIAERELGPSVEIVNLAVPGYSTDQQLLRFEREVGDWDPDLVLLNFVLNDVTGNITGQEWTIDQRKPLYRRGEDGQWQLVGHPVPAPDWHGPTSQPNGGDGPRDVPWREAFYSHSALLQALFPPDAAARRAQAWAVQALERLDFPRSEADLSPEQSAVLAGMNQTVRALCDELVAPDSVTHYLLGELARVCRERGIPLVVFAIAHNHDQYLYTPGIPMPVGIERHLEPGAEPYETHLTRRLREAGAMLGFGVFSVDQAMLEVVHTGRTMNVGDGHLNELGNRVVAARLATELRARLGSPAPR
ncbi:MAG: hypothetical protein GC161_10105 [Planctomycetaceae bacterium]|nr:hypothetical protein [Planctomycetaceae bacterium]